MRPIVGLRIALALVMGWGALRLLMDAHHGGPHGGIGIALGVLELLGAVLFLISRTIRIGTWLLAASLVLATLLHAHSGQMPPPVYLLYAAGLWTVAAQAP